MRTLATKQPSNSDSAHQKPVRANPTPIVRFHSVSPLSTGMSLLQCKCACGGGCPRCQAEQDLEEALPIQTKLKISKPGDKYEQEADRIADQVMRMPEQGLQLACTWDGGCFLRESEQPGQNYNLLQAVSLSQ